MHESIPQSSIAYTKYYTVHDRCICVYKKVGYTPLQVLSDIRTHLSTEDSAKCTYAGRLDPMAEGWMYIVWSGDAAEKKRLTGQDKIYEVEVLLGVSTDTGDVLGVITSTDVCICDFSNATEVAQTFVGPFTYPYPTYSSPHMKKVLRADDISLKKQNGFIHSVALLSKKYISTSELNEYVEKKLHLCRMDGDFRQDKIKSCWKDFLKNSSNTYTVIKFEIHCSSGTYMRTFAEEFGKKFELPACAMSIVRIKMITK